MNPEQLRNGLLIALDHIESVLSKVSEQTSPNGLLTEIELHTIAEGLFLSGITHWEQFARELLILDVATSPTSTLHRDKLQIRDSDASMRLATQLLRHPDHPRKFIEWSAYKEIENRANEFLGAGNRFAVSPLPRRSDFELLKRIRNAVAHRSDKAMTTFLDLCSDSPFNLSTEQTAGLTPGRFLMAQNWNGQPVMREALAILRDAAQHLVP